MSNLDGTVFAVFRDGAIRGLNVAQMIRSLTSGTLSGWQENKQQATDLTQLSASFRIELGKATTSDINLVGPLVRVTGGGTVDLGEKSLALRVEPKLVMTTEGQGRATDPVGLGIPVAIDGPWDEPRIYPDIAGILDNPDAAYARLKEMGKGLFGPNGALGGLGSNLPNGNPPNGNVTGRIGGRRRPRPTRRQSRTDPGQPDPQTGTATGPEPGHSRAGNPCSGRSPGPCPDDPPRPQESQPMNDVLRQLFNRGAR